MTGRHRVLIVDDDPVARRALATILDPDHEVRSVGCGQEALAHAAGAPPPDLILLDLMLPDLSGDQVLRRLRAIPASAEVPVIVVTALDRPGEHERALELGAVDYITKPLHPSLVRARVDKHLLLAATRQEVSVRTCGHRLPAPWRDDIDARLATDLRAQIAAVHRDAERLLDHPGATGPQRRLLGHLIAGADDMLGRIDQARPACAGSAGADATSPTAAAATADPAEAAGERARILVVDDERLVRRFLADTFADAYEVLLAKDGRQALDLVRGERSPDVILLDVLMPEMDGYQVLEQLKADERARSIPVIFITGANREGDEARGLALGVSDYIPKPLHPAIVRARVRNLLNMVRQQRRLAELAAVDPLTGLANRRRFDEVLDRTWRQASRGGRQVSLAVIDVDFFKRYNDHYGHGSGDRALRAVADAIAGTLRRSGDLAARYGGEEFVVVMPDTDAAVASALAETIRLKVAALGLEHARSAATDHLTVSVGGTTITPAAGLAAAAALERADRALYQAKHGGRNRVVWAR